MFTNIDCATLDSTKCHSPSTYLQDPENRIWITGCPGKTLKGLFCLMTSHHRLTLSTPCTLLIYIRIELCSNLYQASNLRAKCIKYQQSLSYGRCRLLNNLIQKGYILLLGLGFMSKAVTFMSAHFSLSCSVFIAAVSGEQHKLTHCFHTVCRFTVQDIEQWKQLF